MIPKFRAKRIDMDRWVYGQYFITPLTDENSGTTPDSGWFFLTGETRHCIVQNCVAFVIDLKTLGQYTGLKDKNGKEIYEGDIIQTVFDEKNDNWLVEEIGALERDNKYFGLCVSPDGNGVNYFIDKSILSGKVIGNIYANADLLSLAQSATEATE